MEVTFKPALKQNRNQPTPTANHSESRTNQLAAAAWCGKKTAPA